MAALSRTITCSENQNFSTSIAEDLHFYVLRPRDELFQINAAIAKAVLAESHHGFVCFFKLLWRGADAHPDASATGGTLQHHRVSQLRRRAQGVVFVSQQPSTGQQRNSTSHRDFTRCVLKRVRLNLLNPGPDEDYTFAFASTRKLDTLTQESIPRMNRL